MDIHRSAFPVSCFHLLVMPSMYMIGNNSMPRPICRPTLRVCIPFDKIIKMNYPPVELHILKQLDNLALSFTHQYV